MSVAKSILDSVTGIRETGLFMLEHYLAEGIISKVDAANYADYLSKEIGQLEYKLQAIFGICESRLQVKKEKND